MSQTLPPFSCVYSMNIPGLLLELKCTLAITTYQAGKLIFISAKDNNSLVQLAKTVKNGMGLAFDGQRLAMASKESVLLYSAAAPLAALYPRQTATYDTIFLPRAQYFTGLADTHDMVWVDKKLLMVSTRFSCLSWLDDSFNFLPCWKPPFITALGPEDRCHLNGVALHDGKIKYVTMFGESDTREGWRANKASGGLIMDTESNEIVVRNLAMPHTPRMINNELYTLLSAAGELIKINTDNGTYEVIKKFPGYVRGMAFYKGFLFIAYSKIRDKQKTFSDIPVAATSLDAGIAVMHFTSGNIIGEIKYQNSVEEIYDVQVLPFARPGLVGFEQPERDLAISLPGDSFWGIVPEE